MRKNFEARLSGDTGAQSQEGVHQSNCRFHYSLNFEYRLSPLLRVDLPVTIL